MQVKVRRPPATIRLMQHWPWLGLLLYMLVVGFYFIARYSGRWAESDSATFAKVLRAFVEEGRLVPTLGPVYPNGYAFQALSAYIVALTGLEVAALQQLVFPLTACLVVLPAWTLYRELSGSTRGATLATLLLFTQPEFLFVILRSSHEKFSRALMLLCLFLLVRSFKLRDHPSLLTLHVSLFCLTTFALVASNNLLAHSFIVAVGTTYLLARYFEKRSLNLQHTSGPILQRLRNVVLICLAFVYVFTFYVYPPALHDLLVLKTVLDRVAALFLDVGTKAASDYADAYTVVASGWISVGAYFLVSIANWMVLATSFAIWMHQGIRWLLQGKRPKTQMAWLLWLLYAAFAAQGGLSAVADASGALSSNLQHRLFPTFSIFAVAMTGTWLAQWRPQRLAGLLRVVLAVTIFCISILSILKATNEPLVSNKWTFYRPAELAALVWSTAHLEESAIWTEYDERLIVAFDTAIGDPANHNHFQAYRLLPTTRNIVLTSITRLRSSRLRDPLPVPPDAFRVYDNGDAEVYHLRPQTPHQR